MCNLDERIMDTLAGTKITPTYPWAVSLNEDDEYELSVNSDMTGRIQEWMECGASDAFIRMTLDVVVMEIRKTYEQS